MGKNLRSTFNSLTTVFSPACIAHEIITSMDWTAVEVDGVSLPDALICWANSLPDNVLEFGKDSSFIVLEIRSQMASNHNLVAENSPR